MNDAANTKSGDVLETDGDVTQKARELGRDLKNQAADLTDTVTTAAKEHASELASSVSDKVQTAIDGQRGVGADYIGSIARAADRVAEELDGKVPYVGDYIRTAADTMDRVAEAVRYRDAGELVGEVQDFARRQPAIFFGGALMLGFAAVRFFRSSVPQPASSAPSNHTREKTAQRHQPAQQPAG